MLILRSTNAPRLSMRIATSFWLWSCSSSTGSPARPSPDAARPVADAALDAVGDASSGAKDQGGAPSMDAASGEGGPGTVTVATNLALPGFPQAMDVYLPTGAERVVVFLHGGGGTKEGGAARELGVRLDDPPGATPVPDTVWLTARRTAFVFPQGQALKTAPKATTWSNYVMTSGVDDLAFLAALSSALRDGSFGGVLPPFSRVYLAGHSNGGMMAARVFCEATAEFDAYGALSGPPSIQLAETPDAGGEDPLTGAHPCRPSASKPYLAVIGGMDTILQTDGHWSDPIWTLNACLTQGTGGGIVDPNLLNEERFQDAVRLPAICGGALAAPMTSPDGRTTTWSGCGGRAKLLRVNDADHCVVASVVPCLGGRVLGNCTNSLDAEDGTRIRDVLVDFFAGTEP